MSELPSSYPEKHRSDIEDEHGTRVFPRWMFVHELRTILAELEDDDWVRPNMVHNLAVGREVDGEYNNCIAAINFYWNNIEWYDGRDEEE